MRARSPSTRVALVLLSIIAAFAACGTLEGLDQYTLEQRRGAVDASTSGDDSSTGPPNGDSGGGTDGAEPPGDDGGGGIADGGPGDGAAPGTDASDAATDVVVVSEGGPGEGGAGCTCVSPAPSGWQGYVQLTWGDGGDGGDGGAAGALGCAAPYAVAKSQVLASAAGNAQCSACTCAPPPSGPIVCQVQLGSGGALCFGEAMTVAPQGFCTIPPGPVGTTSGPNGDSYGPTMVGAPTGNCTPDGGVATRPAAQTTSATVCAAPEAGVVAECGSSQVCVATPASRAASVATNPCIFQTGVHTCPAPYTATHVVSTGVTDTRGCGACSCAAPGCPADGYVQGYTTPNCTGNVATTFDASSPCVLGDNANLSVSFMYFPTHGTWNGGCPASGGAATGGVALDTGSATTYCCLP